MNTMFMPPIYLNWIIETRPEYTPGIEHLIFRHSQVIVFTMTPIVKGILPWNRKTEYRIYSGMRRSYGVGSLVGGTYSTREIAKAKAMEQATLVFRGSEFADLMDCTEDYSI